MQQHQAGPALPLANEYRSCTKWQSIGRLGRQPRPTQDEICNKRKIVTFGHIQYPQHVRPEKTNQSTWEGTISVCGTETRFLLRPNHSIYLLNALLPLLFRLSKPFHAKEAVSAQQRQACIQRKRPEPSHSMWGIESCCPFVLEFMKPGIATLLHHHAGLNAYMYRRCGLLQPRFLSLKMHAM